MNRESYPLLHDILALDKAERLEIVGVLLKSLAASDKVDREWLEDARQRFEAACTQEGLSITSYLQAEPNPHVDE